MSNREDFYKVLAGKKPERIPCIHYGFWDESSMHKLAPADCYDENTLSIPQNDPPRDGYSREPRTEDSRSRAVRMAAYLDDSTIGVGKGGVLTFGHGGPGELQPRVIERTAEHKILLYEGGHKREIHFHPHSIRYYDFPVKEEADLERLKLPDMRDPARYADVEADSRFIREAGFVPTAAIQGFFSGIHNSFMDFQDALTGLLLKPEFMLEVTLRLARMSLEAVEMLLERGVEGIDVCDDLGTAEGLLLSPALFRKFFLPWYEELVHRVHARKGFVHMHSHGNIAPILMDLVGAGVDIINPFDWSENPDLPGLIRRYGERVVFCGGSVPDLYRRPLPEVESIVRRACSLAALAGRGYMFMANAGMNELSREEWEGWREIFRRVREEMAPA